LDHYSNKRDAFLGSIIASQRINGRIWNGNTQQVGKIQPQTGKLVVTVLGATRLSAGTFSGEGHNNKQCSLQ
jgi:hypothetical protein